MKLLNCIKCNDIKAVRRTLRWCECGRCCAVYVKGGTGGDGPQFTRVMFAGPARLLGICNIEFDTMITNNRFMPDLFVEDWDDPPRDYDWRGPVIHLPEFEATFEAEIDKE